MVEVIVDSEQKIAVIIAKFNTAAINTNYLRLFFLTKHSKLYSVYKMKIKMILTI